MEPLNDLVPDRPRVVLCGRAGDCIRGRTHYYDAPGNSFWQVLHASGLIPDRLEPADDARLPSYGVGLTDLVSHDDPHSVEIDELVAKVERWKPDWLAFTSKTVAREAARALGAPRLNRIVLGPMDWYVGPAQVFVLPGTSGANQRADYDGRPDRLSWWQDLAALAR